MRTSLARWFGLVCTLFTLSALAGCSAVLGDFDVAGADDGGSDDGSVGQPNAPSGPGEAGPVHDGGGPIRDAGAGDESQPEASVLCAPGQKACGGACIGDNDPNTSCADPSTCAPCDFPNAIAACAGGSCALDHCLNGFQDCNGVASDGCEVHTAGDPSHCGSCGAHCSDAGGAPSCSGGTCSSIACDPSHADCDHDPKNGCEVHTSVDVDNCGTCGYVCGKANGTPSCNEAGDAGAPQCVFACNAPYAHCPSSADKSGCDVNTNTDNANCGKCGNACALGTACINGSCTCNAQTCPSGCCDSTGACVTATSGACGKSGAACAACAAGQECNATTGKCVCDATSCPNGCCDATGKCVTSPSNAQCGKGGVACASCGSGQACASDGASCVCTAASCPNGCCNGNACVPVGASQSANECGDHGDVCGKCASGQACSNGTCSCGGTSCSGCCNAGTCVGGTAHDQCGSSGSSCATCAADQECNAQGKCVCDATTCPNGCCDSSGHCQTGEGPTTCGKGGVACGTCGAGQECNATTGKCACDATSCPGGCCNGATCVPYANETQAACGTGGAACGPCAQGERCNGAGKCVCDATSCPNGCCDANGQCQASGNGTCGTGGVACAICATGQECVSGACKCDANSCGHGCCSGNTCVTTESSAACGTGGASCATCATGQECNGTACVCDATSCPNGCCNGNTCVPYASETNGACGAGGVACAACPTGQECSTSTGKCQCDARSCPNGCCNASGACTTPSFSSGVCGTGGIACVTSCAAPTANGCNASGCSCNGAAACTGAQICCGGGCSDLQSDAANCGKCGHSCGGGACSNGVCQPWAIATGRPASPLNLALDPNGRYLFWTENNNGGVYQIPVGGGTITTLRAPDGVGNSAWAVVSDGTNVYWTDRAHGNLAGNAIDGAAANFWTYANPNGSGGPYGITYYAGYVYAADFGSGHIWYVAAGSHGATGTNTGFPTYSGPTGMFHPPGTSYNLWVLYASGTVLLNGTSQATGTNVDARYVTGDGTYVYWTASDGNQIWYAPASTTASSSPPTLISTESQPWGIATDGPMSIYWVNKTNGTIRHATYSGGWSITTIATGNNPTDIRVDANAIYWADFGSSQIYRLNK